MISIPRKVVSLLAECGHMTIIASQKLARLGHASQLADRGPKQSGLTLEEDETVI